MFRTINVRLKRTADLVQTVRSFDQDCQRVLDRGPQSREYNRTGSNHLKNVKGRYQRLKAESRSK
ncbi:MAG: hypothetical protein KAX80_14725, partial [Planctomycetes bacterium]|nr:hypothetical protein [Planctomycetota bacterium]